MEKDEVCYVLVPAIFKRDSFGNNVSFVETRGEGMKAVKKEQIFTEAEAKEMLNINKNKLAQ